MASSSSSQDFFDLIPMESESAESSMSFMPLDSESPLPELELVIDTGHVDSSLDSFDESVFETVAESATRPMKSGDIWIDGDSIMTVCPDCSAPISIRHWLMHANCWRCGTVVQLTAWQEAQVRRLLNESDDVEEAEIATAQVQPAVVFKKPKPTLAHVDIRQQAVTDQLRLWAKRLLRNTPAWLSSFLVHLILLIMMGLIDQTSQIESPAITLSVVVDAMDQEGGNIVETNYDQEEEYELPLPEDVDPEDVEQMEKVRQDIEVAEQLQQDFDTDNPNLPDLDSVKRRINEATGRNTTIVARDPRIRAQVVMKEGGTTATEAAVAKGLQWLAKHQRNDGSWTIHKFDCNCRHKGSAISDSAATSLALLPFLGAGQTHLSGMYKQNVAQGLRWLIANQVNNGDLSAGTLTHNARMYAHGQGAIVLCEAYMMTGDSQLKQPAQKSIDFIVKSQHAQGGWRYAPGQAGDTSVMGWQVMALQSARAAGLYVPDQTMKNAHQFLNTVQKGFRYGYVPNQGPTHVMTAEAMLCRMYLGPQNGLEYGPNNDDIETAANFLIDSHAPDHGQPNYYYLYYATQTLHHYGGPQWERWNSIMREVLTQSQLTKGHEAGSWTPVENHDRNGGRLYSTVMAICCLEVYYRHLPIFHKLELDVAMK